MADRGEGGGMALVAQVRRTIRERRLVESGERVLVGCSGGPDSAALLLVLARLADELGLELHAASVDHGLRRDAERDVAIARQQASDLGVPFHALRVVVDPGASIQANARAARYAALGELRASLGAGKLAIGHTCDDQAETVLMRILRGAGVRGLRGISPQRSDGVIRPLIDCRRDQVLAFACAQVGKLAQDPGNQDPQFFRVRVRQMLIPQLVREDPKLLEHLAELADETRVVSTWLDDQAAERLACAGGASKTLSFSEVDANAPWFPSIMRLWVGRVTDGPLGRSHLSQLRRAVSAPAEVWLPGGWSVHSDGCGTLQLVVRSRPETAPGTLVGAPPAHRK